MSLIDPADVFPPGRPPRTALIDVRAPGEVDGGAIPGAVSLPILSDEERHRVGLRYAEAGPEAAVALGAELTAPHRAERGPTAVFCWRGGMRSALAHAMIDRPDVPRVRGGYKALRRHLVAGFEAAVEARRILVLTGLTGSGKTEFLHELRSGAAPEGLLPLDLEGAAAHRGSSFGRHLDRGGEREQPAQATFEHRLALATIASTAPVILVEDESHRIGSLHLPKPLWTRLGDAPVLVLEDDLASRAERIHHEYIAEPSRAHGVDVVAARLEAAIDRIRPRLGHALADRIVAQARAAAAGDAWYDPAALRPAIDPLLTEYYDPLYRKALDRRPRRVEARGPRKALLAWLRTHLSD